MSADKYALTVHSGQPTPVNALRLRQWWSVITALLVAAIFTQAVFAGALLSGASWANKAHAMNAAVLIVLTAIASVVSLVTLNSVPRGTRLGMYLMSLAMLVFVQTVIGKLAANGANLLWLHVPSASRSSP